MCAKDSNKYCCMIENLSCGKLSGALATPIQLVCFAKALFTYITYDICTPYLSFVHVYSPRNVIGVCNRSYQNCFLRWCPNTSIVHIEILFSLLFLILLPSIGYHPHLFLASTLWFEIQLWYYQHIAILRTSLVLQKEENIRHDIPNCIPDLCYVWVQMGTGQLVWGGCLSSSRLCLYTQQW